MHTMTTVSEVLNKLKKEGYTVDFNLDDNCLICHGNALQIHPDEFVVDESYRFEGVSDPADEAVVYAISSTKHNLKGTLVNGYGMYSESMADELVKALNGNRPSSTAGKADTLGEKYNQATPQRPAGDRPLNAPLVEMNLNAFRQQIKQEKAWQSSDRNAITLFKSEGMRVVLVALHEGAEMKTHTAPGTISVQVLEGQIRFSTEQQVAEMSVGQMLTLQPGIPHSVLARQESVFLLTLAISPAGK
ncbi:cupin domain-containing protein [Pontibacter sp. 172403-2]|uniref:cupin domain-containing protein n=1 Tax=Pontibacter rufus TaxID=2791028 RepID=UPI0018AF9F04|nr:cupin domain-containing protein [Pontibacter sp. 172403-2]MBF9254138.1 cupin domain-containing protein [Pontibacter sp. 172403-2]